MLRKRIGRYVCMHTRLGECVCVCISLCTAALTHPCMWVRTFVPTYEHIHECVHVLYAARFGVCSSQSPYPCDHVLPVESECCEFCA